jgi:CRISPR-associated protein Cmr2
MQTNNTYLALTIGPIYKTLQKAKNTQSLWGGSYLFSYLMQQICLRLKEKYANDFVIPYIKDDRIFKPHKGAGLFPDRLIIKNGLISDLKDAVQTSIENLVKHNVVSAIIRFIQNQFRVLLKQSSKTTYTSIFY